MKKAQNQSSGGEVGENKLATRLTFSYKGDKIKLVSQKTLKMTPLAPDTFQSGKRGSGFWYELKDAKNRTQFRRVTSNPIRHYTEVRSGDPDRPLSWEKVDEPSGIFTLLIPVIKGVREIRLFSSPQIGEERGGPAREIARFVLADDQTRKER